MCTTLVALLLLSFGCAKRIELVPDRDRPLPQGTISRIEKHNGITRYELKVTNLLPPSELDSEANLYIVWESSQDGRIVKKVAQLGAIKGSKKFTVETSLTDVRFYVTAELAPDVNSPTGPVAIKEFSRPATN
ncbi:MAG: hypothetical protein AB1489_23310 [Acidobacteriota bacterium]